MKSKKAEKILNEQLQIIKPSEEILRKINNFIDESCTFIQNKLIEQNISAEVFIGGSLAKGTIIKKEIYDVDIFVRFDRYKNKEISNLLGKVLGKGFKRVHGSRDYFQLLKENILLEIIPVLKIDKPEFAENVTDLSYFHVKYVTELINKDDKLKDEIILSKNFCYAQNVYGAESYIKGFSGYALELLICHYKTLLNLMKEITKIKREKLIIDDAGYYSNKDELMREMNVAKRQSPIILVDPTFKYRNALSSLSDETFSRFKKMCERFLKYPSKKFFLIKSISDDFNRLKNVKILSVNIDRQSGDIAGTKSKKFYKFFIRKLKDEFKIGKSEFDYDEKENKAYFYFVLSKKKDEVKIGPSINDNKNIDRFKKIHPSSFIKGNFIYAKIKHTESFDKWFLNFIKIYKKTMTEMGILELVNLNK